MNKPIRVFAGKLQQEIDWTVAFLKNIQNLRHNSETKVRTVNLLVLAEGKIQSESREMLPR